MQIGCEFPTALNLVFWKPYPWVKILKNMLNTSLENLSTTNYTKPLFRIAWHFWTNTKYSGEVSLIISMDIFIGSWLSVWELYLIVKHMEISLYAQTQQSLLLLTQGNIYTSLEISKQISCVLRGIKRAIPRKLVKISHCRVSSFLKTVPSCRVSRHSEFLKYMKASGYFYQTSTLNCIFYL